MAILFLLLACRDITGVDDGTRVGDVVQLKDLFTSVQLLRAGDRVVLFDGGFRSGRIERQLADEGVALEEVTDVFLTHGHPDHLAVIPDLPNAVVHGFAEEVPLLEEETDGEVVLDELLTTGDTLTVGTAVIEPFLIGGHTPGSAVYLVGDVLILGDAVFQTRDGGLVVTDERYSEDPETLRTNLLALGEELSPRAETIRWLLPSHTAPVEGFDALLAVE
jgi:glyoxylase-like metal-dependent hydrolase (beta-lactamase superfamily II)